MKNMIKKVMMVLVVAMVACVGSCSYINNTNINDSFSAEVVSEATETATSEVETEENETKVDAEEAETEEVEEAEESAKVEETTPVEEETPKTEEVTPAHTNEPVPAEAPTHTHSYTSSVTKEATCDTNGTRTYVCSCGDSYNESIQANGHSYNGGEVVKEATCAEAGGKVYTCTKCGAMYTEAIPANGEHSWATRHVDEVGHYESSGTHQVMLTTCGCGFVVRSDDPDANTKWLAHRFGDNCQKRFTQGYYEASNGDSKWVVDVSAHDESYCTLCGVTQ